ncbi:hypothetical protein Agub_g3510, partial [Astrephomene gubernaculifera]
MMTLVRSSLGSTACLGSRGRVVFRRYPSLCAIRQSPCLPRLGLRLSPACSSGSVQARLSRPMIPLRPVSSATCLSPITTTAPSALIGSSTGWLDSLPPASVQLRSNLRSQAARPARTFLRTATTVRSASGVAAPTTDSSLQSESSRNRSSGGVSFFATCHPGLEQVVAQELTALGYWDVEPGRAGVAFRGRSVSSGYAANMWLRSAIRVLVLLAEGRLDTG